MGRFGEFLRASLFHSLRPSYPKPPAPTQHRRTENLPDSATHLHVAHCALQGILVSCSRLFCSQIHQMPPPCCFLHPHPDAVHNIAIGGLSPSICILGCLVILICCMCCMWPFVLLTYCWLFFVGIQRLKNCFPCYHHLLRICLVILRVSMAFKSV